MLSAAAAVKNLPNTQMGGSECNASQPCDAHTIGHTGRYKTLEGALAGTKSKEEQPVSRTTS